MIADPRLPMDELGQATKRRASNVLPCNHLLRAVFRRLRDRYGETGVVAWFTRRWPCKWIVDLTPSGGGFYGPFRHREAAIAFEVAWLEKYYL